MACLTVRGLDPARVLSACGLSFAAVGDQAGMMRLQDMVAIWDEAERTTRDWALGLDAAAVVPTGAYGALDFIGVTAATVSDSFRYAAQYLETAHGAAQMTLSRSSKSLALEFDTPRIGERHEHRSSEFTFGLLLHRSWAATGVRWTPSEVDLVGPRPGTAEPFHEVFGSRVRFEQPVNRLVLPLGTLDLGHRLRDDALCGYLRTFLDAARAQGRPSSRVADKCRELLQSARLPDADVTAVARRLGMSPRSLQRALMAGGETFRTLRDGVWANRARELLAGGYTPTEVATHLGFSESSAFRRAFRRWTGILPRGVRSTQRKPN